MAIFSHRRQHIVDTPRGMTCFFFCVLLLVLYYMLVGRIQSPFADPYVQTPTSSNACYRGVLHTIIISIDAENRIFLQADEQLQTSLIQQVAKQHGISFTTAQLRRLSEMPYLSQGIEHLPKWLAAYGQEQRSFTAGISGDAELSEYITTGLQLSQQLYGKPAYFALRADKTVLAPQIQHMMQLIQQHGIKHISLITEQE